MGARRGWRGDGGGEEPLPLPPHLPQRAGRSRAWHRGAGALQLQHSVCCEWTLRRAREAWAASGIQVGGLGSEATG